MDDKKALAKKPSSPVAQRVNLAHLETLQTKAKETDKPVTLRVNYGTHHLGNLRDKDGKKSKSTLVPKDGTFKTTESKAAAWMAKLPNKFSVVETGE